MKLIIIIQTLIIIVGGYYIYLLSNPKEEIIVPVPEPSVPVGVSGTVREGYIPPTGNPPADPVIVDSEVTGQSGIEMEYPIPDEEIQVR